MPINPNKPEDGYPDGWITLSENDFAPEADESSLSDAAIIIGSLRHYGDRDDLEARHLLETTGNTVQTTPRSSPWHILGKTGSIGLNFLKPRT